MYDNIDKPWRCYVRRRKLYMDKFERQVRLREEAEGGPKQLEDAGEVVRV